ALDARRLEAPRPTVRDRRPNHAAKHDGGAPVTAVARGNHVAGSFAPGGDDPVDRVRRELGAVRENHDRRLRAEWERRESATKRGARTALPVGTADGAGVGLEIVGPDDHDDVVDRARASHAGEHRREQQPLLGRAEPRRGSGRENDGADHAHIVHPRVTDTYDLSGYARRGEEAGYALGHA